jgi:uncharacterized glyoxalase superfamily protein PhnB
MSKKIPDGYHAVTPSFTFKDSLKAIEFYKKAFDAKLLDLFPNMDGNGTMHATIQISDSILMMEDENPGQNCKSAETLGGTSPISLFLYVSDVDAVFKQAIDAGATMIMPVAEMFWGDRVGSLKDPFGYQWMVATHKRDMSKEQIREEAEVFFAQFKKEEN